MSNNTRRFIVQAEFEYEAEVIEGDPVEVWAFSDLQQGIIRTDLENYIPGILPDYPIKVTVTPDSNKW